MPLDNYPAHGDTQEGRWPRGGKREKMTKPWIKPSPNGQGVNPCLPSYPPRHLDGAEAGI